MPTLISFASGWGCKHGGINSFNTDFITAFGFAYHQSAQIICMVENASIGEIEEARSAHVELLCLPFSPQIRVFNQIHARACIDALDTHDITFDPSSTVWLGHDRITGIAAIGAARYAGGRSAVIHHMSYDHYESFAENSITAKAKVEEQRKIFSQADLLLAVGPLLRDALSDLLSVPKQVHMLVPGLADITVRPEPKRFAVFMSGRLSDDAARIKQGHLGIAAFARAHFDACTNGMPDGLRNEPKLVLRGVDFEANTVKVSTEQTVDAETELKLYAEQYSHRAITLHALPYTHDRQELFGDLSRASVAMMPSWHEGFGLVAWEAIAAGVPLILSERSGVYRLLQERHRGDGTGCVCSIDVQGTATFPFFTQDDLTSLATKLKEICHKSTEAKTAAGKLRSILEMYTWSACATQAAEIFGWALLKGSLPPVTPEQISVVLKTAASTAQPVESSPINIPAKQWSAGAGLADSHLLRAEEALVPFDPAREPELENLQLWLDDSHQQNAIRLITGAGGLGKTRLALELCSRRSENGWHAGFLDGAIEEKDILTIWQKLRGIGQPLLIVIDYAETRQNVLLSLIKNLVQHPADSVVRLLLLARDAGEWWENLASKDSVCEAILCGDSTTGPYPLPSLHQKEIDRRQAYHRALAAFANALNTSPPNVVPELSGEHFGKPLYLQMAALLALHGERPTTAEGLTNALLNHERRYWNRLLSSLSIVDPEQYAERLLALTTMCGGFITSKDAEGYWIKLGEKRLSSPDFTALFKSLIPLYPGRQGLQGVRPDLLGEALVSRVLLSEAGDLLLDAVLSSRSSQAVRQHALTTIARLSSQRPHLNDIIIEGLVRNFSACYKEIIVVSKQTVSHLPTLAEAAFERLLPAVKRQVAGLVAPMLFEESTQLADLGYFITNFMVEKSKEKLSKKQNNQENLSEYSTNLGNLCVALARTGRYGEACLRASEVVTLFEKLDSMDPVRYKRSLSTALLNYAGYLGNADLYKEALHYDLRAVGIRKSLLKRGTDPAKSDYVKSMQQAGDHLMQDGQVDESVSYIDEALIVSHDLYFKDKKNYVTLYSDTILSYSDFLSDTGKYQKACNNSKSAIEILKEQADIFPDQFEYDYSFALLRYGVHLSEAGEYHKSVEQIECSRKILQRMSHKNPTRYSYQLFLTSYSLEFVKWLVGAVEVVLNDDVIPVVDSPQFLFRMQLYNFFFKGCLTKDATCRCDCFRQVVAMCPDLTNLCKSLQPYYYCSIGWLQTFDPKAVEGIEWQSQWNDYRRRRNDEIPHWMQETSRKLMFQWPAFILP